MRVRIMNSLGNIGLNSIGRQKQQQQEKVHFKINDRSTMEYDIKSLPVHNLRYIFKKIKS